MMVDVSRGHARIVTKLIIILSSLLDPDRFEVVSSEFGVNTSGSRRYPDVLVEPLSPDLRGRTSEAPIFIAEVLSSSSVSVDMREKPSEYMELSSLQTYAVFSENEPMVWVWTRGETGFPEEPAMIEGTEKTLAVPALGVALPLADIYRGIGSARG